MNLDELQHALAHDHMAKTYCRGRRHSIPPHELEKGVQRLFDNPGNNMARGWAALHLTGLVDSQKP